MLQELNIIENLRWDMIALGVFFLVNLIVFVNLQTKLQTLQRSQAELNTHLLELAGDVKALYESGTTLGSKVKSLEFGSKVLKEEQEKLSLKDPDQQMYRNAVQQINNGETVNQISASSGLSRGEIELLKRFQKIENELEPVVKTKVKKKSSQAAPEMDKAV